MDRSSTAALGVPRSHPAAKDELACRAFVCQDAGTPRPQRRGRQASSRTAAERLRLDARQAMSGTRRTLLARHSVAQITAHAIDLFVAWAACVARAHHRGRRRKSPVPVAPIGTISMPIYTSSFAESHGNGRVSPARAPEARVPRVGTRTLPPE